MDATHLISVVSLDNYVFPLALQLANLDLGAFYQ